ncbi:hypothetical protein F4815DRAFT_231518 [Daldinia loculata]|uniref:uncharacterized protein n=1 Tax=Daldinia loculata TaxID=103429 RepID=UPI0020C1FB44|nr:uncharacterized protein F4817DRAFT_294669 [Daldinia loculata]KAI1642499.1 hypothetical protein F4817DRAFT_294669 [Daldinia loculata]KAI2778765.1 hypothetical protein F4815DRAFT_231518 [Daldinia loculata]
MSKAFLVAKEKYQAVIDDAGRGDFVCRTNRIGATRLPSSGDCHAVNMVDHPQQRRRSSTSMRDKIRDLMNRPAY